MFSKIYARYERRKAAQRAIITAANCFMCFGGLDRCEHINISKYTVSRECLKRSRLYFGNRDSGITVEHEIRARSARDNNIYCEEKNRRIH